MKRSSRKRNFIKNLSLIIILPRSKVKVRSVRNVYRRVARIVKPPDKKLKFFKTEDISGDVTKRDDSSTHDEILSESTTDPADENFFDLYFKIIQSKSIEFKMKSYTTSNEAEISIFKYNAEGQETIQLTITSAKNVRKRYNEENIHTELSENE